MSEASTSGPNITSISDVQEFSLDKNDDTHDFIPIDKFETGNNSSIPKQNEVSATLETVNKADSSHGGSLTASYLKSVGWDPENILRISSKTQENGDSIERLGLLSPFQIDPEEIGFENVDNLRVCDISTRVNPPDYSLFSDFPSAFVKTAFLTVQLRHSCTTSQRR